MVFELHCPEISLCSDFKVWQQIFCVGWLSIVTCWGWCQGIQTSVSGLFVTLVFHQLHNLL
uniref:Uncharacterized protein n=1 Tax=Anguilla anguilla TaxID=7936 RepID=A0A0E9REZ7_ANGAN